MSDLLTLTKCLFNHIQLYHLLKGTKGIKISHCNYSDIRILIRQQ